MAEPEILSSPVVLTINDSQILNKLENNFSWTSLVELTPIFLLLFFSDGYGYQNWNS
jgi:hypothetical protein